MIAIFLFGCASGKEAREVARITLDQIITYEELIERKVKAEQVYYKESLNILHESLKSGQFTTELTMVTKAAQDFQSYVFHSKKDLQPKELRDSVYKLLESLRHSRARYANALTEYNEDLRKSLAALEVHKESLKKVRKGLEQLQAKPSDVERLKEWFEFAKKMKKEYENSKPSGT